MQPYLNHVWSKVPKNSRFSATQTRSLAPRILRCEGCIRVSTCIFIAPCLRGRLAACGARGSCCAAWFDQQAPPRCQRKVPLLRARKPRDHVYLPCCLPSVYFLCMHVRMRLPRKLPIMKRCKRGLVMHLQSSVMAHGSSLMAHRSSFIGHRSWVTLDFTLITSVQPSKRTVWCR